MPLVLKSPSKKGYVPYVVNNDLIDSSNIFCEFYVGPNDTRILGVAIGHINPSATLDLVGTLRYRDGNQTDNYVLTSDADGFYTPKDIPTLIDDTLGGNNGDVLTKIAGHWMPAPVSGGSVTSVGLASANVDIFGITNTPITTNGNIQLDLNDQDANTVLAGPTTGFATTPTFRALVADDIPSLDYWKLNGNTVTTPKSFGTVDNYSIPFITNNTERLRILNTGEIGIDTSSPLNKLDIKSTSPTNGQIGLSRASNASVNGINLWTNNTLEWAIGQSTSTSDFSFFDITQFPNPSVTIKYGNPYVGINNSNPTSVIHIKGKGNTIADNSVQVENQTGAVSFKIRDDASVVINNTIWFDTTTPFKFISDGLNSTNVFIGQTAPHGTASNRGSITAVGANTLPNYSPTNADNMVVAIGNQAGLGWTGGTGGIFIGKDAGANGTYTHAAAIGSGATVRQSNAFVFGDINAPYNHFYLGSGMYGGAAFLAATNLYATGVTPGVTDGSASLSELIFNGARGTGTGVGGDIIFKTAPAGSTGSTQNTLVEAVRIKESGVLMIRQYTATQASALTATDGDFIYVNSTNGTFTSVGFWGYENGAWVKL